MILFVKWYSRMLLTLPSEIVAKFEQIQELPVHSGDKIIYTIGLVISIPVIFFVYFGAIIPYVLKRIKAEKEYNKNPNHTPESLKQTTKISWSDYYQIKKIKLKIKDEDE